MDVDSDLPEIEDIVQQFLASKLEVMKIRRQELEQHLLRRKEVLDDILHKGAAESLGRCMAIGSTWKMIVNEKYVIGINVSNIGEE